MKQFDAAPKLKNHLTNNEVSKNPTITPEKRDEDVEKEIRILISRKTNQSQPGIKPEKLHARGKKTICRKKKPGDKRE